MLEEFGEELHTKRKEIKKRSAGVERGIINTNQVTN